MPLARLTAWLRPVTALLALAGTLALSACGGGSGAVNAPQVPVTPTPSLATLPAGVIIAYSQVPTTIKIVGGVPPYQALSNNPAVLSVPFNVSGDTLVLVPNPVAPNVDVPVAITITDQSGQAVISNITVRFAPLFANGLTVTPSGTNCGANLCDGENATVRAVATGIGGTALPGRQIRFDVVFGPFAIVTSNPALPLASSLTVVTDIVGVAEVQIQATPGAVTQQAQIRATDVTTGQQQQANFVVERKTSTTNLSVVPPSAAIQTLYNNVCSTGFIIDYYIYGGTPPYTVASTFPASVTLAPNVVGASGGFFRVTTNGTCVNPVVFTIQDAAQKTTTAQLINIPGTLVPPGAPGPTPPTVLSVAPGAQTSAVGGCSGGNTFQIVATNGTPPYNAVVSPSGPTIVGGPSFNSGDPIGIAFPGPAVTGTFQVIVTDAGSPAQVRTVTITCN
jgi:hypothetical protein